MIGESMTIQIIKTRKKDILYREQPDGPILVTTDKNNPQIREALQQYNQQEGG